MAESANAARSLSREPKAVAGALPRPARLKAPRLDWHVARRFAPGGCWLTVGRYASAGQAIFKQEALRLLYPDAEFRVEHSGQAQES